jgi:hypothetical protein
LYGHVHTARRQANLPPVSGDVKYKSKRAGCTAGIADLFVRRRVETHLSLIEPLDTAIRRLEAEIEDAARGTFPVELAVLQSTPGVGQVLSLTILLEMDTVERFDTRQQFCSYARLCGAVQESDNKRVGHGNARAGNAWLKWAFSEAAVLSAQKDRFLVSMGRQDRPMRASDCDGIPCNLRCLLNGRQASITRPGRPNAEVLGRGKLERASTV